MEVYNVTVWDSSAGSRPDDWVLESPPVKVQARDSYEAARKVASRAGIALSLASGISRPYGGAGSGMFFRAPEEELVFQVEDSYTLEVPRRLERGRRVFGV